MLVLPLVLVLPRRLLPGDAAAAAVEAVGRGRRGQLTTGLADRYIPACVYGCGNITSTAVKSAATHTDM